jgi:hypothetical protein
MTNAFGRGLVKISDEGTFKALNKLYVKRGADWQDAKTAWIKQNGEWIQVYPTPRGQITFDPPTLNFEAANGYESPTQFVSITNTGDENVIIEDFSVSYTASGKFVTFFDLSELGGQIPATIAPGETKRLGIAIDAGSGSAYVEQEIVTIVDTPTLKKVNILCPLPSIDVDYLVVAGGGGGGGGKYAGLSSTFYGQGYYLGNAGGGAGGVVLGYKRSVKRGETVQIKVGQGGAGGPAFKTSQNEKTAGQNGGNSSFGDIVAVGGGGGGSGSAGWGDGQPGGSGGGAVKGRTVGTGTLGQGFSGSPAASVRSVIANAFQSFAFGGESGGGGGAGGSSGSSAGGPGRASTITGTRQYYGGGGGGGTGPWGNTPPGPGVGGVGGGGAGGVPGTANTGGGGGGGLIGLIVYPLYSSVLYYPGGNGGSGVVVIKYEYDVQLGQGGTVTTYTTEDGVKNWVHTFTQDGTFTYNEVLETKTITVTEQVVTTTQQLGLSNAGELGSSDSTIRMKTNVGAFGTEYINYTIFGEVTPPYAEADILPGLSADLEYFRYNPRQTRQEFRVKNIGNGSLIISSVTNVGPYFNIISYPDAIAPKEYGLIVVESRVDDNVQPGIYTDVVTIRSNDVNGDILLNMTLDVMFPAGNLRISTGGAGKWVVPEGVYRLSEVRVIGAGGGGGQGFNQQAIPQIPNPNPSIVVDYLVVGGGGGGGGYVGGGGGGGGVSIGSTNISQGSPISVSVGQGGAGGDIYRAGRSGGNSVFNNIIAKGGGGGSSTGTSGGSDLGEDAGAGGSGGGASSFTNTINNNSLKIAGIGTSGQGYPGGAAAIVPGTSSENRGYGAGGGGAGGAGGTTATWTVGGAGGPGVASDITGAPRIYGAGGGGASHQTNVNTTGGAGGDFGGGAGSNVLGIPFNAINFTGAGGGGAGGFNGIGSKAGSGGRGGSGVVVIRYQSAKQICSGGEITSYNIDGLTYWVHTFKSTSTFTYTGLDPVLVGGINTESVIIPGAGAGGGGGSGSIVLVANVDVMPGEAIEYVVGAGGAGVDPILSTTNPAPAGKPGQTTSFNNGLVAAGGGLGGGGGGPNTGGVGAGNTPNPRVTGVGLVPRTLSWAWSGHMNTYAVWDNPSDASNAWYTVRKFTTAVTDSYTFHLSCDNYGVLYLNGPAILSTTSFQSVTRTTVAIQKDTVNIIGMYAQNWGGPCGYALHVTDSAGRVVWDTRTYRAGETIESLPGTVSRKGGIGQNGTAGVGNGGHGGSNTLGLGGVPGLYDAPPPAGSVYFANQAAFISGNSPNLVVPGNFTVECWIKQTGRPNTWNGVFEIGQWPSPTILLRCFGVDLDFYWGPGTGQIYPYVNINQWHHIAVSRSGTLTRVYVDGIARLTVTIGGTLNPSGLPITIGGNTVARGRTGFTGYISNFRFVNGTALYTDNFTPPRQLLTAVPGTVILACQTNDATLNSTGLVALSKYGNPVNSDEMPFAVINKPVTLSAGGRGRGPGTGGGGGASGVDGQFTPASGAGADGELYIAWGPIVPRDPPQNLIAHFVIDIDEQRFYDRVLPYCNPYSMVTSGFFTEKGRNYALFNGASTNYIGTPADPKYDLVRVANSSFTIEAWVILRGAGQYPYYGGIIVNRDAEYEVAISQNDQVIVAIDWGVGTDVNLPGSGWIIPPAGVAVVPRNVPTHVAVVANQSTLLIYINGTLSYTTPLNRVARRDNTPVWIGNRPGQSQGFNGGIADVRIWNVARTQAQIQTNIQALVYNTPQGI